MITLRLVWNSFDHFSFHSPGKYTDSPCPSRSTTLENRLLCRLMHTRGICGNCAPLGSRPVTRPPGESLWYGHTSTHALSANSGTLLDSFAGRSMYADRGSIPYTSPPRIGGSGRSLSLPYSQPFSA